MIQRFNESRKRTSVAQLDVPIRKINEVLPKVVLRSRESDLHKRPPLGSLRFSDQAHVRFSRKPVPFARIAVDAGANHVFPSCGPAAVARNDVIEIELAAIKELAAVLAGVLVALEHVVPGKFHFLLREPIKHQQYYDARDPDLERDGRDDFMVGRVCGQIAPGFEIVGGKIIRVIRRNNLGVPCVNERKGAASRADVHRLPEPVEYQNLTVQQCMQIRPRLLFADFRVNLGDAITGSFPCQRTGALRQDWVRNAAKSLWRLTQTPYNSKAEQ
jgi:hypothetical protein